MVWLIRMRRAFLADAMSRNLAESMWNASARSLEAIAVAVRTLRSRRIFAVLAFQSGVVVLSAWATVRCALFVSSALEWPILARHGLLIMGGLSSAFAITFHSAVLASEVDRAVAGRASSLTTGIYAAAQRCDHLLVLAMLNGTVWAVVGWSVAGRAHLIGIVAISVCWCASMFFALPAATLSAGTKGGSWRVLVTSAAPSVEKLVGASVLCCLAAALAVPGIGALKLANACSGLESLLVSMLATALLLSSIVITICFATAYQTVLFCRP